MSLNIKQVIGSALLTAAVIGGVSTYLNASLSAPKAVVAYDGVTTEQPAYSLRHAEVIVTEGRAS